MTPGARVQAAIEILDEILAGTPAEKSLTNWGRRSRFAGSKDRAAVRDHVFHALRCMRSHAALGGAMSGRGLLIGGLRDAGVDPSQLFTAEGHAPGVLAEAELEQPPLDAESAEGLDIPDWLWPLFCKSLGAEAQAAAAVLRTRAPVFLRVNLTKIERADAILRLAQEEVVTLPHDASATALEVTEGARRVKNTQCYLQGLVELQDAASQAVVDTLPLQDGQRVLDFCAGGGGKTLAMAGRAQLSLFAHDVDPRRMTDVPNRAERAGVQITCLTTEELATTGPFDVVFCDAPCSGSGSWRRDPEGKWRLTSDRLEELVALQAEILDQAAMLVSPDGVLAFATCSMLDVENGLQSRAFVARTPGWKIAQEAAWHVQNGTDGFYVSVFQRTKTG
ncbi:RsmB/NOP family class I SAM-dependent RNA methyltransferase [Tritonibacter horizontis]|uniref:Ribosomal RNA small subunit methyltransferase B n=1 Tax=Tritonibacter horizontis TaxID=1768241 RepID=A0A132BXP4_9RHOB|nr:RsmB/NOP family class I SAM-dependent RNA methyltransferase [Tritonibacter horizontis]KUP92587.1 ribosomal RNA small subunit methyltransferase B [Tritonibacter horizontis]